MINTIESIKTTILDKANFLYSIVMVVAIVLASIMLNLGMIATIALAFNVICVVLVAMRHYLANIIGVIGATMYGYVAYTWGLYGEAILNVIYFAPFHLIAVFVWYNNRMRSSDSLTVEKSDIVMKEVLGYKGWIVATITVMLLTVVFAYSLTKIGGNLPLIDSFTTSMSIIAMFLLMKRYREQWLFWIGVNISSIVMWLLVFAQNPVLNQDAVGMMLMWGVFLINSIVGFYRWYFID